MVRDPTLSPTGVAQAHLLGQQLRADGSVVDRVVSSPLSRALHTAVAATAHLPDVQVQVRCLSCGACVRMRRTTHGSHLAWCLTWSFVLPTPRAISRWGRRLWRCCPSMTTDVRRVTVVFPLPSLLNNSPVSVRASSCCCVQCLVQFVAVACFGSASVACAQTHCAVFPFSLPLVSQDFSALAPNRWWPSGETRRELQDRVFQFRQWLCETMCDTTIVSLDATKLRPTATKGSSTVDSRFPATMHAMIVGHGAFLQAALSQKLPNAGWSCYTCGTMC